MGKWGSAMFRIFLFLFFTLIVNNCFAIETGELTPQGNVDYRVGSTASTGTPSIAIGSGGYDIYEITALATGITTVTMTGTPMDGTMLEIIITDNGSPQTITWGAGSTIASTTVTLPTTTVASTPLRVFLQYQSSNTTWYCVGVA